MAKGQQVYLVVEFTDDKETAVVPSTWLRDNRCILLWSLLMTKRLQ